MIDFKKGIKIIKGCDLTISTSTTMADIKNIASDHIISYWDVGTGYTWVTLPCDTGLNYEDKNRIAICCHPFDDTIERIQITSFIKSFPKEEDRKRIVRNCRRWLLQNDQKLDDQIYDWGLVSLLDDMDFRVFVGITIMFKHPYNQDDEFFKPHT